MKLSVCTVIELSVTPTVTIIRATEYTERAELCPSVRVCSAVR